MQRGGPRRYDCERRGGQWKTSGERTAPVRLYLINPGNPLVSLTHVRESHWNHYRVWKPLGLLVLAALAPREWEISVFDENIRVPAYPNVCYRSVLPFCRWCRRLVWRPDNTS